MLTSIKGKGCVCKSKMRLLKNIQVATAVILPNDVANVLQTSQSTPKVLIDRYVVIWVPTYIFSLPIHFYKTVFRMLLT